MRSQSAFFTREADHGTGTAGSLHASRGVDPGHEAQNGAIQSHTAPSTYAAPDPMARRYRFPASRRYLWDRTLHGQPIYIQPTACLPSIEAVPQIINAANSILQASGQQIQHSAKLTLLAQLAVGAAGHHGRLKLQPKPPGQSVNLAGPFELLVPCSVFKGQQSNSHLSNEHSTSLKATLSSALNSRGSSQLSQLFAAVANITLRSDGTAYFDGKLMLPGTPMSVGPLGCKRVLDCPLSRQLCASIPPGSSPDDGFLTMDAARSLVPLHAGDPLVFSTPLVGVWVRGVEGLNHPLVLAACFRFAYSTTLPDRAMHETGAFLLAIYPPGGCAAPTCYEVRFQEDEPGRVSLLQYSFQGELLQLAGAATAGKQQQVDAPVLLELSLDESAQQACLLNPGRAASPQQHPPILQQPLPSNSPPRRGVENVTLPTGSSNAAGINQPYHQNLRSSHGVPFDLASTPAWRESLSQMNTAAIQDAVQKLAGDASPGYRQEGSPEPLPRPVALPTPVSASGLPQPWKAANGRYNDVSMPTGLQTSRTMQPEPQHIAPASVASIAATPNDTRVAPGQRRSAEAPQRTSLELQGHGQPAQNSTLSQASTHNFSGMAASHAVSHPGQESLNGWLHQQQQQQQQRFQQINQPPAVAAAYRTPSWHSSGSNSSIGSQGGNLRQLQQSQLQPLSNGAVLDDGSVSARPWDMVQANKGPNMQPMMQASGNLQPSASAMRYPYTALSTSMTLKPLYNPLNPRGTNSSQGSDSLRPQMQPPGPNYLAYPNPAGMPSSLATPVFNRFPAGLQTPGMPQLTSFNSYQTFNGNGFVAPQQGQQTMAVQSTMEPTIPSRMQPNYINNGISQCIGPGAPPEMSGDANYAATLRSSVSSDSQVLQKQVIMLQQQVIQLQQQLSTFLSKPGPVDATSHSHQQYMQDQPQPLQHPIPAASVASNPDGSKHQSHMSTKAADNHTGNSAALMTNRSTHANTAAAMMSPNASPGPSKVAAPIVQPPSSNDSSPLDAGMSKATSRVDWSGLKEDPDDDVVHVSIERTPPAAAQLHNSRYGTPNNAAIASKRELFGSSCETTPEKTPPCPETDVDGIEETDRESPEKVVQQTTTSHRPSLPVHPVMQFLNSTAPSACQTGQVFDSVSNQQPSEAVGDRQAVQQTTAVDPLPVRQTNNLLHTVHTNLPVANDFESNLSKVQDSQSASGVTESHHHQDMGQHTCRTDSIAAPSSKAVASTPASNLSPLSSPLGSGKSDGSADDEIDSPVPTTTRNQQLDSFRRASHRISTAGTSQQPPLQQSTTHQDTASNTVYASIRASAIEGPLNAGDVVKTRYIPLDDDSDGSDGELEAQLMRKYGIRP